MAVYGVLGATGLQGGAVIKSLLQEEAAENSKVNALAKIKAFTRDPAASKALELAKLDPRLELVPCDMNDADSLAKAFEGCQVVFGVTDYWQACKLDVNKEMQQGKNIGDACVKAGVEHLVYSSLDDCTGSEALQEMPPLKKHGLGIYKVPHFDGKQAAQKHCEELAKKSGGKFKFTALYTTFYLENFLGAMKPARVPFCFGPWAKWMIIIPTPYEAQYPVVSVGDIGRAAVYCLVTPPKGDTELRTVDTEFATGTQMADALSKATGNKTIHWGPSYYMFSWFPFPGADDLANMFQFFVEATEFTQVRKEKAVPKDVVCVGKWDTMASWCEQNKKNLV